MPPGPARLEDRAGPSKPVGSFPWPSMSCSGSKWAGPARYARKKRTEKQVKRAGKHGLVQKSGLTSLEVNRSCRASPPCLVSCSSPVRLFVPGCAMLGSDPNSMIPNSMIGPKQRPSCRAHGPHVYWPSISAPMDIAPGYYKPLSLSRSTHIDGCEASDTFHLKLHCSNLSDLNTDTTDPGIQLTAEEGTTGGGSRPAA